MTRAKTSLRRPLFAALAAAALLAAGAAAAWTVAMAVGLLAIVQVLLLLL